MTWKRETPDGTPHAVFAYALKAYAADRASPALVWLHGYAFRDDDGGGFAGI